MSYVQGFLIPVPQDRKDEYIAMARQSWSIFRDLGALDMWECWEDDVSDGQHTSFPMAVKRQEGEKIVFSWILWPDAATYKVAFQKMESDPEIMAELGQMCFDGRRMMWGGFTPIFRGCDG